MSKTKNSHKRLLGQTFRGELMVAFICIGVIPFVVCCIVLIQMFQIQTNKKVEATSFEIINEAVTDLDDMVDQLEKLSERIAGNVKLSQALAMEDTTQYTNLIYKVLYEKTSGFREYANFALYDMDGNVKFTTEAVAGKESMPVYWGVLKKAIDNPYSMVSSVGEGSDSTALYFARVIIPYDRATGFLVISIEKDTIENLLRGMYGGQDGLAVMDEHLHAIFEGGAAYDIDADNLIRKRFLSGTEITEDYGDYSVSFAKLSKESFYVAVIRPNAFTQETLSTLYRILFIMAGVILLISIIISNVFAINFSKPIRIMRENMREVRKGNLEVRMEPVWNNEFSDLANSFNHMTSELKDYMELQVSQQKELNGTQIAMMQAQLNPHFLYNTLDTMKWVAKANHVPKLVTLVSKLSKILRASISKEQFVTLKSEMELVDSYAEIQKIRFDGKFECTIEYAPELEDVMVPKLVVQPIVENAVIHGLEDFEDGHIMVEAYAHTEESGKTVMVIEVADDGRGITDDEIARLNEPDEDTKKGHIGVRNVARIIELNYGSEYGLNIRRGDEGGTVVTMTFPIGEM